MRTKLSKGTKKLIAGIISATVVTIAIFLFASSQSSMFNFTHSGVDTMENTIYDLEAEYILALPTEPDPGSFSAIDQVTVTTGPVDPAWYTIDGRRLPTEPSAPGLYIHNGKKVIKR